MTAAASALPFPWESLDATNRAEVAAIHEVRGWVERHVRIGAFEHALKELLGVELRVLVRRSRPFAAGRVTGKTVGVLLACADDIATSPGALFEVEAALAATVLARTIRRPRPVLVDDARAPSPAIAGALAAVLLAAARRAYAGAALRVFSAGEAAQLEAGLVRLGPDVVELTLTVLVDDEAFDARLLVSRAARGARVEVSEVPWTLQRLSSLGPTPLSLPVVAAATRATVADVAVLRPGDVWLPGAWELSRGSEPHGPTLRGPVFLAAPSSETGVRARLVEGGGLVLSGEVEPLCALEADMVEPEGESTLLNAVGDVPVIVRVEIGEAQMTARQWASLGRGDVVTLGRRVGAHVLLRVGGVPVARGELVSVDGEVGVRIAERVGGEPTTA
jgi:flagellar motor switch/type III secretory pathway protein FliN